MRHRYFIRTICALAGASVLAATIAAGPALAGTPVCVERKALVKGLDAKYQERRQGLGITAANQGALEFFASENGSWTIIITTTAGRTCILASGHSRHGGPYPAAGPKT